MATAPAIMPNAADAASPLPFVKAVTARLATATAGAAENRPENSLGSTASPTNENATTTVPPANAFRHTIQRSLTCSPVPGAAQRHAGRFAAYLNGSDPEPWRRPVPAPPSAPPGNPPRNP